MKIAIICPVYDAESYIHDLNKDILNQRLNIEESFRDIYCSN